MKGKFLLAIDQGTSSSRTVIYDHDTRQEFAQIYPRPGWVEHDPEVIWNSVTSVTGSAMKKAGVAAADISAIGVTNQRETTLIWDRDTGECVYNAIVWQDRRTLPRAKGRGARVDSTRQDRPAPRSLFFRHQDHLDSQ
jgi:glycerol kinase